MTGWLLFASAAVLGRLPWSTLAPLGALLGWLAGSVLRYRRGAVEAAMARAGLPLPRATARAAYRELGRGVLELLALGGRGERGRTSALDRHVAIDDASLAALDEALARGPVVLVASHTGNWELAAFAAARALAARGRRLAVVAKRIHAPAVDAFVRRLREAFGLRLIAPAGALAEAARALAAGDVVAMPIDQVPDRRAHAVPAPFLGATALVDRAPATLALRARATLLVVAAAREAGTTRVRVLGSLAAPTEGSARRAFASEATAAATALLDAHVRAAPASWLWLHRRWRAPLEAGDRSGGGRVSARRPRRLHLVAPPHSR